MNNSLIIGSKFTITDVTVIQKVFRYYVCKISLTSNSKSVSDVHKVLHEIDLITSKDEYILLINYELPNTVTFSCDENLQFYFNRKLYNIHGTFSHCSRYFIQLFVIRGFINEYYVPLVYFIF